MSNPVMGPSVLIGMAPEVTPGTPITATELYEMKGGDLKLISTVYNTDGLIGTRSPQSERTRNNSRHVSGQIILEPSAKELSFLLPRIMGAVASGTTFALAETIPPFTVTICKDNAVDGKVMQYTGCYVNKATFGCEAGQPLKLTLDIEGIDEVIGAAGTFPVLTLDVLTGGPFMFSDSVITVAAATYKFKSMEFTIDNMLDLERYLNSLTRTALPSKGRSINVKLDGPYGSNAAAYPTLITEQAGVAVAATFTNTLQACSLLASFIKVHFVRNGTNVNGKEELMMPLEGVARATIAAKELICTLDSTP